MTSFRQAGMCSCVFLIVKSVDKMPKYLALDYVTEALQHRQSQVERMQVPTPHHIEFVDAYIHKGEVIDCEYRTPWEHLDEFSYSNDANFMLSASDENIKADFHQLSIDLPEAECTTHSLESFCMSTHNSRREDVDDLDNYGSDNELFLLSQDIDSAIERFLPACGSVWTDSTTGEVFSSNVLNHERLTIEETVTAGKYLLESPQTIDHFESVLDAVPSVDDLSKRLKPKMIQDPLLDDSGQSYSYERMFSDEQRIVTSPGVLMKSDQLHTHFEEFNHHTFSQIESSNDLQDLLLEVDSDDPNDATNNGGPPSLVADNCTTPVESSLCDLEEMKETSAAQHPSTEDLTTLRVHFSADVTPTKLLMKDLTHFSPTDPRSLDQSANPHSGPNESCDSEDSGLGQAYLESPIVTPPFTILTSSPLTRQLRQLKPLPISPEGKLELRLLSPNSEKLLLKKLLEIDNVFDPILALTIPYPTIEDGLVGIGDTVCELIAMLSLKQLDTNEDSESENLAWDPLVDSYQVMAIANHSLVTPAPLNYEPLKQGGRDVEGSFEKDSYVEIINEDEDELPLNVGEVMEATKKKGNVTEVIESDIPSIRFNSGAPSGYLKASSGPSSFAHQVSQPSNNRDVISPSDAASSAWNLVQISNSSSLTKSSPLYDLNHGIDSPRCTKNNQVTTISRRDSNALPTSQWGSGTSIHGSGSALDDFMLLRFSGNVLRSNDGRDGMYPRLGQKRAHQDHDSTGPDSKRVASDDIGAELVIEERKTTPIFHDVCFTGEYQSCLLKIESFASTFVTALQPYGFQCPRGQVRCLRPDTIKFFLKQQQKQMMDSNETGDVLKSCQLSASLYILCTVLDLLTHCSLGVGQGRFLSLCERYSELVGNCVDFVKQELLCLQLISKDNSSSLDPHPKLREMVGVVCRWMKTTRKSWREKAVVVVEREFNSLSGEILDFLQSIPNMKSCVFSFTSDETSSSLYLKAVEERFHHYDCLVVPTTSLTDHANFPWEKVTLLIEYEQLRQPLFQRDTSDHDHFRDATHLRQNTIGNGHDVDRLRLREYVALRSMWELDMTAGVLPTTEKGVTDVSQLQYTFIASENVTNNTQLLQLMETRYNILIIPRDYPGSNTVSNLPRRKPSKKLNYVDLILDQSTGILLRPLSLLCVDTGTRVLISTLTALSLQYETCWLLLYTEDKHNYPFRGNVPANLARLYASVATYCPRLDEYRVKILTLFSVEDVAKTTRRIAEEVHTHSKVWSLADWTDREWLNEDMSKSERILLSFPCMNSFSAQCVLREFTIGDVMSMEMGQLKSSFPWMPNKVIEFFYKMCHSSAIGDGHTDVSPSLPTSAMKPIEVSHTTNNPGHDQTTTLTDRSGQKSSNSSRDCEYTGRISTQPSRSTTDDVITLSDDEIDGVTVSNYWRKNYQDERESMMNSDCDIDLVVISDDETQYEQTSVMSPTCDAGCRDSCFTGDGTGVCDPNASNSVYSLGGTLCEHSLDDSLDEFEIAEDNDAATLHPSTVTRGNSSSDVTAQNFEMNPDTFQSMTTDDSFMMFKVPANSPRNEFIGLTEQQEVDTDIDGFCHSRWSGSTDCNPSNERNLRRVSFDENFTTETATSRSSNRFLDFLSTTSSNSIPSLSHHKPFTLCNNNSNTFNPPLPKSTLLPKHPTSNNSNDHVLMKNDPASSTMRLFSSSQRLGKTPTQKQIRETVMRDIALSNADPSSDTTSNKVRLAREYYSGAPPASFIASSAVRHTSSVQRTPIRALDLGIGKGVNESAFRLKSNDRIFTNASSSNSREVLNHNAPRKKYQGVEGSASNPPFWKEHRGSAETNKSNVRRSLFQPQTGSSVTSGFGMKGKPAIRGTNSNFMSSDDLRAFHQDQGNSSSSGVFATGSIKSSVIRRRDQLATADPCRPWPGHESIGATLAGAKRSHFGPPQNPQTQAHDSLVPTISPTSPPSAKASLYGSPNPASILSSSSSSARVCSSSELSPLRKRRLICQKDNLSCNGQTRLRFQ